MHSLEEHAEERPATILHRKQVEAQTHQAFKRRQIIPIAQEDGAIIPAYRHTGQNRGNHASRKPAGRRHTGPMLPPHWSVPEHRTDMHLARERAVTPDIHKNAVTDSNGVRLSVSMTLKRSDTRTSFIPCTLACHGQTVSRWFISC